jgi:hypothetical protein
VVQTTRSANAFVSHFYLLTFYTGPDEHEKLKTVRAKVDKKAAEKAGQVAAGDRSRQKARHRGKSQPKAA